MDLGIKGKRALVVGGGKGIGRGIADALAREGVDVAIASRNAAALDAAAAELARAGVRSLAVAMDLADHASIDAGFARVVAAFGGVDILVNNSGGPPPSGITGVTDDTWRAQFEAMVLSIMHLTNLALPAMRAQRWGRVMTVASSAVIQPIPSLAISNTLRAALVGWSKTLAAEVGKDGVTVNMLLPGSIKTQRITSLWEVSSKNTGKTLAEHEAEQMARVPVGRIGTIEEFGAVAAFIAGVPAAYITGSMIRIDGGAILSV
jgi:3-oxoacyl-[acyl-carrier protein] reductase